MQRSVFEKIKRLNTKADWIVGVEEQKMASLRLFCHSFPALPDRIPAVLTSASTACPCLVASSTFSSQGRRRSTTRVSRQLIVPSFGAHYKCNQRPTSTRTHDREGLLYTSRGSASLQPYAFMGREKTRTRTNSAVLFDLVIRRPWSSLYWYIYRSFMSFISS